MSAAGDDPLPTLQDWVAVVLAAGRGTRMRSHTPKVLHRVAGLPMVRHVCDAARAAGITRLVLVVGPDAREIAEAAGPDVRLCEQPEPLGTGHAALAARAAAGDAAHVLILNADLPLLTPDTLRGIVAAHLDAAATLTFAAAHVADPTGYGRVARIAGRVTAIVEQTETDEVTAALDEVNVGLYAARAAWLWNALEGLAPGPRGERYLTDVVARALAGGEPVATYPLADPSEAQQVNDRIELARAEGVMRDRVRRRLMTAGVTLVDPATTYVDATVEVGADTTLLPGVHLLGATTVGAGSRIGPNTVLRDSVAGDRVEIGASTIEGSRIGDDVTVGPYCHVRPGSTIEDGVHLGNYVEVKASRIGARTQVGHFSYVGDADIGQAVNVGAGSVTANYDGVDKHRTQVGDGAFIGVDSVLIAPVVIGAGARTAAGSVVTHDVPPGAMVMGVPARLRSGKGDGSGLG
jgi:bifunctional UDP-N-acetylglucosamine pyrophosphorylase/glucosamine-1-phosphate N-acetyltransferase